MTDPVAPDSVLWAQLLTGDLAAFKDLHERHADRVFRHCYARLGQRDDAEDATNQVFLEIWRKRNKISIGENGAQAWLLATASNVCRNQQRSRKRQTKAVTKLATRTRHVDDADEREERLDADRYAHVLRSAIASLSPKSQEIVSLCAIEGLTYEEASSALRVPIGTVRSRLSRAKEKIRRQLVAAGYRPDDINLEATNA